MNILRKYIYIIEILFILIISLIPLLWFKPGYMVYGSDSGYPLNFVNYFVQRSYTWFASQNFGMDMSTLMGLLPLHGIQYVLSIVGVPYFEIQKVTFIFWFAVISFSMYFCVRYFFKESDQWIIRIIAVVVYVLNFYIFLFWQIGSQTTLSAYAFLPLCFLILFKFINKDLTPLKTAIYLNLSFFLFNAGGVGGLSLLGPSIVVACGLIIYQFVTDFNKKFAINVFKLLSYSLIIFFVLNAYFLFPFLSSFTQQFNTLAAKSGGISGVIEWAKSISKFDSYSNLFRLQGDNIWYVNNYSYPHQFLTNPILIIFSFFFPILAYLNLGFIWDRRIKRLLFYLIPLSLVGIFLSAGTHNPLGFLYELMLRYIPGFSAFRSPYYKFIPLVYFCFAILSGMGVYYLSNKVSMKHKNLIGIVFIVLLFAYHYPFFQVKNFLTNNKYSTMIQVPEYVKEFAKLNLPADNNYRTLVLPPLNRSYPLETFKWDYYSASPIYPGITDRSFVYNNAYLNASEKQMIDLIYKSYRDNNWDTFFSMANLLNIKYILLTSDIYTNTQESPRENAEIYKQKLTKEYFNLIWQKGEWILYEIVDTKINSKIFSFGTLNKYEGNLDGISGLDIKNPQFIKTDTAQLNATSQTPINNIYVGLPCISCVVVSDELNTFPTRITPRSIFYPVKLYLESRSLKNLNDSQKIDANLGLSLKRLNELKTLAGTENSLKDISAWDTAVNLLISNWRKVMFFLEKNKVNEDIFILYKVENYAEFEMKNLIDVYNNEEVKKSNNLRKIIKEAILEVSKAHKTINSQTMKFDKEGIFLYLNIDTSDIYPKNVVVDIDNSLMDINDMFLSPTAVKFDEGEVIDLNRQNKTGIIDLLQVNKRFEKIYLYFPPQKNQLIGGSIETIDFSNHTEKCQVFRVNNYRWDKIYQIVFKINRDFDNANVYVKYLKEVKEDNSLFFEPNLTIDISKEINNIIKFNISGRENYLSARIYFCGSANEPQEIFSDIKGNIVYKPDVYLFNNLSDKRNSVPRISYEKINPTEYLININNAKNPFFLGFSDRYSSDWKLYEANSNKSIDNIHFALNGYANGWYITKSGSYDIKMRYIKQDIFVKGIIISITAFLFISLYLIISILITYIKKDRYE